MSARQAIEAEFDVNRRNWFWTAVLLVSMAAVMPSLAGAQVPKEVTIGAAPVGGVYFIEGGGFAELLNETLGIQASVVMSGGPLHNIQLLDSKRLDFGMVTSAPVWEGWHGHGWAKGKQYRSVRVILPMYKSYFQMYALKTSGIRSIKDLNGKRVGVGPVGGTPATYWPLLFEAGNIKPGRVFNASSAYMNSQIRSGMLDVNAQALGLPWPVIRQIQATHEINLFGVPLDIAQTFIRKYSYFTTAEIPANTYKGSTEAIPTLTLWNFMAVHKDASSELVYKFLKATFERQDILIAAHSSAQEIKAENIVTSPIPLHSAAVRFFREKGINLPDRLVQVQ
jgi:TRAP transporter TAXI family solute receptor